MPCRQGHLICLEPEIGKNHHHDSLWEISTGCLVSDYSSLGTHLFARRIQAERGYQPFSILD
jgi:hypothetical protein